MGPLGLIVVCGRYLRLVPDRLTPAERHSTIKLYLDDLLRSFAGNIPEVKPDKLKKLYRNGDYAGMLGFIKHAMKLKVKVGLRVVDHWTDQAHPLFVEVPRPTPAIGSPEFDRMRVIVNVSKTFLLSSSFDWIVAGFAHEMAHVVLFSLGHPLETFAQSEPYRF
jgi:hypothetical protein